MPANRLRAAQDALRRGDWLTARRGFESALASGETAEALEGLGMAAWWQDDVPAVFTAREKAFQLYRKAGDKRGAGRVALALAEDCAYFRGEIAVAAGWHRRAQRLLEGLKPIPEHGWLKVSQGDFALTLQHDPVAAKRLAAEAAAIGRRLQVVDLEMMGLALEGLALVAEGHLLEGMPRLDEATTAAVSGEMEDFFAIGFAYCCLVEACELVRDYERAAQWCDRAKEHAQRVGLELLTSVCRTHHASVLIWRGAWNEAEAELEAALQHIRAVRPPLQGGATVRVAQLRRLQGRWEEAEALLDESEDHPLALTERAALALDRGDAGAAARLAERSLRKTNAADLTARIPGLEVLFRARMAEGDSPRATAVLAKLRTAADALATNPIRAAVRLSEGLLQLAEGAHDSARKAFEDAVDLYRRSGIPLETARARLELARVLLALGLREPAEQEARAAARAFSSLGATPSSRAAECFLAELGVHGPGSHLTPREREVLQFLSQGLSNPRIAARLHVSEFTVKRHVANILTKLDLPTRAAAAAYAVRSHLA
jgi:LuxR family transcriptional regulator, maltose regulon positive regulatory protein